MKKYGIDELSVPSGILKGSPFRLNKDGSMTISTYGDREKMNAGFLTAKLSGTSDNEVSYRPAALQWTVCTP